MWTNKEAFLLSKTYIDDFRTIEILDNKLNIEGFCAIKSMLRIAKQKKVDDLKYLFNKYTKLTEAITCLISNNDLPQLKKFRDKIFENDYRKACDFADMALKQVKNLDYFYSPTEKNLNSSYFLRDYQKVICSSSFRRLQDKTQLFVMDSNDYTRTRLTHSIEVSTIAEKIAYNASIEKKLEKYVDGGLSAFNDRSDCVAIAKISGVLHDIGNPPYGHSGEENITEFFKRKDILSLLESFGLQSTSSFYSDICCYDGNAQSLRIASKLMSFDNKEGASLTAGVLGSIIKYPYPSSHNNKKFGYFLSEEDLISDLLHLGVYKQDVKNPFAYILEAADDLAYLISDLEDAIHKKVITYESFEEKFREEKEDAECLNFFEKVQNRYKNSDNIDDEKFDKIIKPLLFQFRENLIATIDYNSFFSAIIEEGKYGKTLFETSKFYRLFELLNLIKTPVLKCKEILTNEAKGKVYILNILNKLIKPLLVIDVESLTDFKTYEKCEKINIIPFNLIKSFEKELNKNGSYDNEYLIYCKCRLLIDFVSGMTDSYAKKISDLLE